MSCILYHTASSKFSFESRAKKIKRQLTGELESCGGSGMLSLEGWKDATATRNGAHDVQEARSEFRVHEEVDERIVASVRHRQYVETYKA